MQINIDIMKQKLLLFAVVLLLGIQSYAQTGVAINATGTDAAISAMLDVSSTDKGMLVPRMTSVQRSDIASPAIGLLVFQTDAPEGFYYYNAASEWVYITNTNSPVGILAVENGGTGTTTGSITGTNALTFAAGGSNQNVTLTPSGTGSVVLLGNTGINTSGSSPDSNAILDLSSTSKGFLPPRMTSAQKGLISNPPVGLMIWCTNCGISGELQVYNGTIWTNLIGGATSGTIPGAPIIGTATPGNGQASVPFTAPASNGGSTITSYTATSSPGNITRTLFQAGSGTITVTGLTNGTAYTITVTATNANGTGAASDPSNSVTPATVPGAPTGVSATAGNAQASVSFTAPASNGGSPITSYTATSTPGNFTGTLTQAGSGTITVTGLTNGTAYTFTVNATNAIGTGAASATSNSVTYAIVPGAPTIGTATAGNAQASVPFTAPASNGGSTIISYTATSTPGSFTGTLNQAASGIIIVTGLTNGTAYSFTVKATNAVGTGAASTASNWVTPATVPGAPIIGTATAAGGQVSVTFTQPAFNGGSAITSYTATSSPGGITGTLSQAGSGTITVTGLNPATPYTFTVTATNAMGTGAASAASNSVSYATIPGAPTIGTATPGNAQASVSFTAPAFNGGSAITSYIATSSPGYFTGTLTQAGSGTIIVSGLTNGTAYTFTVKANNAIGTSAASAASNSVTPATVPGAPTIGTATAGDGLASVPFTVPASNGGSAITSYTATSTPGSFTGTLTQAGSGTITVTGLTIGTAYTFTVTATNAVGTGAASAASNAVTPFFVCGSSITDIRDSKVYTTVQIGTQCWMAQNLNVGTLIPGNLNQGNTGTIEKFCYNDWESNCTIYGGLYSWDEMMQYSTTPGIKGICPTNWHLPTDEEWNTLTTFLGPTVAGGAMKETGTAHWTSPNDWATNTSGFTALPGGFRGYSGQFLVIGTWAHFWSSSQTSTDNLAFYRWLYYTSPYVTRGDNQKGSGMSVRCVRD